MDYITGLKIIDSDRILNKRTPTTAEDDDATFKNARWIMRTLDKLIDGQYRCRIPYKINDTELTVANLLTVIPFAVSGENIFISAIAARLIAVGPDKWRIEYGAWTEATRPVAAWIADGSKGFNTDTEQEEIYSGGAWHISA